MNYIAETLVELKELLPNLDDELLRLYGLLVHVKGVNTNLRDVHEAWGFWQNITKPDHRSLIEFNDLTPEVQELDRKYMNAIHEVAKKKYK